MGLGVAKEVGGDGVRDMLLRGKKKNKIQGEKRFPGFRVMKVK